MGGACFGGSGAWLVPELVENVPPIRDVSLSELFISFSTTDGELYTWGKFSRTTFPKPCKISPDDLDFELVGCGEKHSLASTKDGRVFQVGENQWCQLGMISPPLSSLTQSAEVLGTKVLALSAELGISCCVIKN